MASKRNNLVLATISIDRMAGGLEKNIINLANAMSRRGHNVYLITFDHETAQSFFPLDAAVQWHKTGTTPAHGKISFSDRWALIKRIRAILKPIAPAPIVCFHHGILARFFLASVFLNCPKIGSERNSLSLYKHVLLVQQNFNFKLLNFCKLITVQFPAYKNDYPPAMQRKITCIPNPVFPVTGRAQPDQPNAKGRYSLLSVVRLCDQKNMQALIRAFAPLAADFPGWDLDIVGEGSSYEELMRLIRELGLENRAFLHGKRDDVGAFYQNAHIFCLASKWEGFPNAMAEAMSYGLPAVGYQDCRGVSDIIQNHKTGLLAVGNGNIETLSTQLKILMIDASLRQKLGQEAFEDMQNYAPEKIYDLWARHLFQ